MLSSIALHLIFGQYLSLNLELTNSARLTSSYSLSSTEIPELFTWLQGIWTQVLRFAVTFPVIFQFPPQLPYEINFPIIIQRNGFPCDVSIQTWYFVLIFPPRSFSLLFAGFPLSFRQLSILVLRQTYSITFSLRPAYNGLHPWAKSCKVLF